jgi:hypothetical protein
MLRMGMVLGFTTISDGNVERVLAFPPLVWKFIAPEDPEAYEHDAARFGRPAAELDVEITLGKLEGRAASIDKAWHGIHYLLTKSDWQGDPPWNFLLLGGRDLRGIEPGCRIFTSGEVAGIQQAIAGVTDEWLRSRFDPADMTHLQIYPDVWDRDPAVDDTLGYCLELFGVMRKFLDDATRHGLGMIIAIT